MRDPKSLEAKVFLATVYGEAGGESIESQRAVASVMLNRLGKLEWRHQSEILEVIRGGGFDAYSRQNQPYSAMWRRLAIDPNLDYAGGALADCRANVLPIYLGAVKPITDAVLYYSPRAQAALHAKRPEDYRERPAWNFDVLEEVFIPGTEKDDFRWFRYKDDPYGHQKA